MKKQNIVGNTYGLLTVLADAGYKGTNRCVIVKCNCDAGTLKKVSVNHLKTGNTTSCGCVKSAMLKRTKTIHGLRNHKLYPTWRNMLQRCKNVNGKRYADYGGRGITVCERWHKFENFHADMSSTHKDGLTLERIDNNKGYSAENCKWVTPFEQSQNKRNNLNITFNGKTQCLKEWCKELNLHYRSTHQRIHKGQTFEQQLKMKGMMK